MKTIDAHAHLLHNHTGFDKIIESGIFEHIWLMDISPVELPGLNFATQQEILQAVRDFQGRVYAFGYLDFNQDVSEIDRLKDLGFVGLKPYKPALPYNSLQYYPHYQRAQELNMPILFHTGLVAKGNGWDGGATRSYGADNMRPGHLAGIAEAFPKLQIIGGHMGWPWLEETAQNLYYYANISHDISGYRHSIDSLREMFDRRCHDGTERYFNHKMHFATDSFYGNSEENEKALRLHTFWRGYFEFIGGIYYRWGQPDEQEKFFYGNAKKIQQIWE